MVIFKNKFLVKLIASLCIFLTLLNFGLSSRVYAEDENKQMVGGVLLTPVMDLLTAIGDAILDILHNTMLEQDESLIRLDGSADTWWNRHGAAAIGWLGAILVVIIVVVTAIPSGGTSALAGAGVLAKIGAACFVIKTAAVAIASGLVSGFFIARVVDSAMMRDDIYLPMYRITPEEIFANEIPLLDINFFNPNNKKKQIMKTIPAHYEESTIITTVNKTWDFDYREKMLSALTAEYKFLNPNTGLEFKTKEEFFGADWTTDAASVSSYYAKDYYPESEPVKIMIQMINSERTSRGLGGIDPDSANSPPYIIRESCYIEYEDGDLSKDKRQYHLLKFGMLGQWMYTMYWEFDGSMVQENINAKITLEKHEYVPETQVYETTDITRESTAQTLQKVVAQWYFTLRNLALLVLMVVLIYTGIKIVTESTAGGKAKYKERLIDWLVAMCLLFAMHYIMVFSLELNERLIELIDSPSEEQAVVKDLVLSNENHINKITKDGRLSQYLTTQDGYKILSWGTNLMGGMRIEQQLVYEGTANWVGYALCFLVLVILTLIFTWTYLKRVVYMAFLTMIAPLVAMTYPIDKITDGKAQAFNSWLKEYIFNLLIQPFHLLLYAILVGSAYELAGKNPLYAVVAIGFMTPAEKLLRKFFGFNKAQTPGTLSGAAGAALAMTGMKSMMKFAKKGKDESTDREDQAKENNKIKFSSSGGVDARSVVADSMGASKKETSDQAEEHKEGEKTETNNSIKTVQVPVAPKVGESKEDTTKKKKTVKDKKDNALKRGFRTIGTGIAGYKRGLGKKMYKRIDNAKPIRAMARGLAGLAGATAFGMAGLALGIASGDPSKAFQYTTAGVAGGFGVGKGLAGKGINALSVDSQKIKDEMEMTYYGEDYKRIKLEEEKEEMQHDEDYIQYIMATLGVSRGKAEKILEETGGDCFDAGIRSVEDIAAIQKMTADALEEEYAQWEKENEERLKELREQERNKLREEAKRQIEEQERMHAIAMKKFSDRTPNLTKLGEKKVDSYRKQFKYEMEKEFYDRFREQGFDDEEARKRSEEMSKKAADSIISGIIKFDDAKSDILKA